VDAADASFIADAAQPDAEPPDAETTLVFLAPAGGEIWGGTRLIRWRSSAADPGALELRLSRDDGARFDELIAPNASQTFSSFEWDTTRFEDAERCVIRGLPFTPLGSAGEPAFSGAFALDNTPPELSLLAPLEGVVTGTTAIAWTTRDAHPESVRITLLGDREELLAEVSDEGRYVWDTRTATAGAAYRLRLVPTDGAGNAGANAESAELVVER